MSVSILTSGSVVISLTYTHTCRSCFTSTNYRDIPTTCTFNYTQIHRSCFTSTLGMESTRTCATRKPTHSTPHTHRRRLSPQEGGQGRHPQWQEGQGRRQHAPSPKPPSLPNKRVCNSQASRLTSESLLNTQVCSQAFCCFLLFTVLVYKWWALALFPGPAH